MIRYFFLLNFLVFVGSLTAQEPCGAIMTQDDIQYMQSNEKLFPLVTWGLERYYIQYNTIYVGQTMVRVQSLQPN